MAVFSVEISDADVMRVLAAMAANYGRPETVDNPSFNHQEPVSEENPLTIANPETYAQFANRMVREYLAENVKAYEVRVAKQQAEAAAAAASIEILDPNV